MIALLKLGNNFIQLVEYDSDTIYSQYPLTEHSYLYTNGQDSEQTMKDSVFDYYSTYLKDLLLLYPSVTFLNPVRIANSNILDATLQQQNDIAKMRDFEVVLCYQLIQNWPEYVVMNASYKWPTFLEVEEYHDTFEIREIKKVGSLPNIEKGRVLHNLLIYHDGHIRLDKQPLTNEQFGRLYRVFSLIGYKFSIH